MLWKCFLWEAVIPWMNARLHHNVQELCELSKAFRGPVVHCTEWKWQIIHYLRVEIQIEGEISLALYEVNLAKDVDMRHF